MTQNEIKIIIFNAGKPVNVAGTLLHQPDYSVAAAVLHDAHKKECIEFVEWMMSKPYFRNNDKTWYLPSAKILDLPDRTTRELFELYEQSKTK